LQERLKLYFKLRVRINNSAVSRLINRLCGHSCQRAITTRREILSKHSVILFKFAIDEQGWLKNKANKKHFFIHTRISTLGADFDNCKYKRQRVYIITKTSRRSYIQRMLLFCLTKCAEHIIWQQTVFISR